MTITRRTMLKSAGAFAGVVITGGALHHPLPQAANAADDTARPLLLAHYMPWYQTPAVSGYWGWHWTMNHFNPAQTNEQGRPEIASHYLPLTGPYDSSDDDLLEYQTLLMKLSGIDGVIVDWYGTENFRDYAVINRSTGKLFEHIQRAGLTFAICYEDQTVKHMVDGGHITRDDAHSIGQQDMRHLYDQWFTDAAYLKHGDQPVLFTFGPQYFKSMADWEVLFSVVDPAPVLITLEGHMVSGSLASFPWPQMIGIESNLAVVEAQLTQFYRKARRWDYVVGGAWPGFHDIYAEAGVQSSYGYLDAQDGEIFRATLQMALDQNPAVIQLITWNDYGEGTIIEPTEEFGYQYLEHIQATRRSLSGADFVFDADALRLPLQIFNLRKSPAATERLDAAVEAILSGDLESAVQKITSLTD